MRRVSLICFLSLILAFLVLPMTARGEVFHRVYQSKGNTVFASFWAYDGCQYTSIQIEATVGEIRYLPKEEYSRSNLFFWLNKSDWCTGEYVYGYYSGPVPESLHLEVSGHTLDSATLTGTLPLEIWEWDNPDPRSIELSVNLTWMADGRVMNRATNNVHWQAKWFSINSRTSGLTRYVTASGEVIWEGLNLASRPDLEARIQSTREGRGEIWRIK